MPPPDIAPRRTNGFQHAVRDLSCLDQAVLCLQQRIRRQKPLRAEVSAGAASRTEEHIRIVMSNKPIGSTALPEERARTGTGAAGRASIEKTL
jgi:hypothetical protein